MFRKRTEEPVEDEFLPVPAKLPPIEGLDEQDEYAQKRRPRTWLWTLLAGLGVALLLIYVLVLGALGVYDGLKDRAIENQQIAREHYQLGLARLEEQDYELAIAEFELALRYDSNLHEAQSRLQEAKELAQAQVTPTSETRQGAAALLYRQAVAHYEKGALTQAVAVLDELRGLDPDFQRETVETMLTTAHYQLGLNAVRLDQMEEADGHFKEVLAVDPEHKNAQDQLNLLNLYTAALNNWKRDWSATIQALKGLYALAPDYKDVQIRLLDAYGFRAEANAAKGDWCRAAEDYAAAVEVFPRETIVDKRDEAQIHCQATAEAPTPTPTLQATAKPTARATESPHSTPTSTASAATAGKGRIAFASYDTVRQRHDVYVVELAQGTATLVQQNASQPAWAPSGTDSVRLAFRNLDPSHLGLSVLDLHSNEIDELTAHVEDSTPSWSPDLKQIVFASNKHGDRKWRIYVISPAEVRGEGVYWVFGRMPAWSPAPAGSSTDGTGFARIAYHGCDEHGDNCGLWIMQPGGAALARLTTDASDTAPAWSPDGSQVAFISARTGNWELYVVDAATGQETRLTDHPAADVAPTWSPDGKRIAFLSDRSGGWAVHVLDVQSVQVQEIIATGDAYPDPVSEKLSWMP
ncbi:MAG: DPP IV N-terminal domain-containing protein [Anaerolineae bacterium]|jgi:TolB protein